ncbi:MAG: phosphoglycerate kinase [Patescibacteria group bacterium]
MKLAVVADLKKLAGKRVLVRVDFNIPLGPKGRIEPAEGAKIQATLPTVEYLVRANAKVILVSHLGRPQGCEPKYSLAPIAKYLAKLLDRPVRFIDDCLEDDADQVAKKLAQLQDGEVALLENIRYYPEEEKNDARFAKRLAGLADIFVNDAFATCHRAHASTAGVTKFLPSYAGLLVEKEVVSLDKLLKKPKKPFYVLMGGAKISSKLPTLEKMLQTADKVFVGGGMANSFFKARGYGIGKSKVEPEEVRFAKKLLKNKRLILPVDVLAASALKENAAVRVAKPDDVRPNEYIVDIGTQTMRDFALELKKARTLVWNGPVGLFEIRKFSHGSIILGRVIAAHSRGRAFGVVGGGETIVCLERTGMAEYVDHISTGGGAMLEYLSGKVLPGIKPLLHK